MCVAVDKTLNMYDIYLIFEFKKFIILNVNNTKNYPSKMSLFLNDCIVYMVLCL